MFCRDVTARTHAHARTPPGAPHRHSHRSGLRMPTPPVSTPSPNVSEPCTVYVSNLFDGSYTSKREYGNFSLFRSYSRFSITLPAWLSSFSTRESTGPSRTSSCTSNWKRGPDLPRAYGTCRGEDDASQTRRGGLAGHDSLPQACLVDDKVVERGRVGQDQVLLDVHQIARRAVAQLLDLLAALVEEGLDRPALLHLGLVPVAAPVPK
mmetsp:Transcript_23407/g.78992  ORF Transcript_23407/g.78992 Transcript_23407/m.78992 type:complete len:208 (-) Transcript_23407:435-1058(-)